MLITVPFSRFTSDQAVGKRMNVLPEPNDFLDLVSGKSRGTEGFMQALSNAAVNDDTSCAAQ
jgi:hypothetical protein